jgi:hypothetical protein
MRRRCSKVYRRTMPLGAAERRGVAGGLLCAPAALALLAFYSRLIE